MFFSRRSQRRSVLAATPLAARWLLAAGPALVLAAAALTAPVSAAEPPACLLSDPAKWPAASKPYFMLAVDTSGSMTSTVSTTNACGYSNNRVGHARCAVKNTVAAFSGEVNFGLASFAWRNSCAQNPAVACPTTGTCTVEYAPGNNNYCGPYITEPTIGVSIHSGGHIVIPMLQDHYWQLTPDASNVPRLLSMVDNTCGVNNGVDNDTTPGGAHNSELGAASNTPLGGILFDLNRYFSGTYFDKWNLATLPSPIGTLAQGERSCRTINVILITDGDETCDAGVSPTPIAGGCRSGQAAYLNNSGERLASYEADRLYTQGVTFGGQNFKIRTHVIAFAGADLIACNHIAACGGTGAAYSTANEAQLSQALANIVSGAIKPETCDNTDNNCNGCTDEGFRHYCNVAQTCCTWTLPAQRTTCLNNYLASITVGNPQGDLTLLPCTTAMQQTQPADWLCYNPADRCDNADNNCDGAIDENQLKCGNPLACPTPEVCDGNDNDCDGIVDEGCPQVCNASPEVCDGCDNDCDGMTDDGVASIPCGNGLGTPAWCQGSITCKAPQAVTPGGCVAGGGWNACSTTPQAEACNNLDDNCNGIVDDSVPSIPCVPAGTPGGLVYGGTSQCKMGTSACVSGATVCQGFIGPSAEVCDGVDNDCDGVVDDSVPGVGQSCGINQGACKPGTTACVNGALVCQGGVQPQAETCDGVDNNCNGQTDEAPLLDAPGPGANGCWTGAGNCCTFGALTWCPPPGATCGDNGALTSPCNKGALTCVAGAWTCLGAKGPSPETCDGIDNNCDGTTDNGIAQVGQTCGTGVGECVAGTYQCTGGSMTCVGSVGASPEVCDGKDNDCDGAVDDNVQGLGVACGNQTPPCTPGVTACVGGQIVCQGGTQPSAELCNNIDDNCDGQIDNAPLSDAPQPGQTGCWTLPGNCCSFAGVDWCPPAGATCNGAGTLTVPCQAGTLVCASGGWACSSSVSPSPEVCDSVDNNCDGAADNVPVVECVPAGTDPSLIYGGTSQCKKGTQGCGTCAGFTGPSPEICDGIDNDCDGVVDDSAAGTGAQCGISIPPCSLGTTACVNGVLVCSGGVQPQPEVCDGLDNNCNGSTDEAPLADAPQPGQNGCWMEPGTCCSFLTLTWCPPAGGNCKDNGTLAPPCNKGFLTCGGLTGWMCVNAKSPTAEVCDGIDNDCNGASDDAAFGGEDCGSDVGECTPGKMQCVAGVLSCVGATTPTDEVCDGLDNNCNGVIDDGIPTGGPCTPSYDVTQYPGDRSEGSCAPGVAICDGNGGIKCEGGKGPQPELCDGIDNDCDGQTDEVGPSPDGIDGTQNPNPIPDAKIGEACGVSVGECKQGAYGCVNGVFACLGDQGPTPEQCDCSDNDCNGVVDNENGDAGPPLCGGDKKCVKNSNMCLCASPCTGVEFQCPGGQLCKEVVSSSTGEAVGRFCVPAVDPCGNGCATETVKDGEKIVCGPEGSDPPNCVQTPVCQCKGQNGCQEPCLGMTCGTGKVCASFGTNAGQCVLDNCFMTGCQGCDKACNLGSCVDNPCKEGTCKAGEVCKPTDNFTKAECVKSCAGVVCGSGKACVDGVCVDTCPAACTGGTVCDPVTKKCVANKCVVEAGATKCTDGSCCDPLTGECGNCPCEGVVCPGTQTCEDNQCKAGGGTGGAGGSAGAAGSGGAAGGTAQGGSAGMAGAVTGGAAGAPTQDKPDEVVGLATGGGGCACRTAGIPGGTAGRFALGLAALAGIFLARRNRRGARRDS